MSYPNIIQIKRRLLNSAQTGLPSLTSGELAFTDIDETLYYGLSTTNGIDALPIAGPGAFVSRTKVQDVSGAKTFQDPVTFNASITANAPVIVNSQLDVSSSVEANSYTIDGTEVIDSSRNAKFVDIDASGNVTITGDLTVLGSTTQLDTQTSVTSAFGIINTGSGPALSATQTGNQPVAVFYDDNDVALYIDGKDLTPGYVGIGTGTPNEKLTVVGKISATDLIYSAKGLVTLGTVSFDNGTITSTGTGSLTITNDLSAASGNTIITANDATFYQKVNIDDNLTVTGWSNLDNGSFVTDGAGNVTMLGSLSGSAVSNLYNFIIDGGSF
jgi:hypothetical protein